jgi:hypothetical protein
MGLLRERIGWGGRAAPRRSPRLDLVLTRHFLRRFLENDLISPDADRLQLLVVVGAGTISTTLFISVFLSFKYAGMPHTPGQLAILALNDRFFYLALSMVVLALVAVAQWDSLVVDVRDAAILEPLPVRPAMVRRAKLAAVAILGGAVAVAINLAPSIIFPWLLVFGTRLRVIDMAMLMVAHLATAVAASVFAYLTIIALRGALATLLPAWLFARVSPWAQGTLIVVLGTALLIVAPASSDTAQDGFAGRRALAPPSWFLGLYEQAAGHIIAEAPRGRMTPRQRRADAITSALYARHRPHFAPLARRAGIMFGVVLLITAATYFSNAGGAAAIAPPPPAAAIRRRSRLATGISMTTIVRGATARAGFFFALAVLWRSNVHRLTLACAGAAGLAMCLITLSGIDVGSVSRAGVASQRLLAVQPLFFGALLAGFRHTIRVPVELRAGWGFELAWREHDRPFLAGVRRAAIVAVALPAIVVTLPLFVFLMGWPLALAHAALGLAGAIVLLEIMLIGYTKVPFTCDYVPNENMKALGPVFVIAFLIGATAFAGLQRAALADAGAAVRLLALLAIVFAACRTVSVRTRRPAVVDFHEAPVTTQRLGLHT